LAGPPGWHLDLAPATRWVLTIGLATRRQPPDAALPAEAWSVVRDECQIHGLTGLLVGAVAGGELPVTDTQLAAAAELEVDLTRARMQAERNVLEVTQWFDEAGVEVRLLKGLALATLDYPDRQWRPTGDVDLLVRGDQLARATDVLVDRGGELMEPDPVPGYGAVVGKGAPVRMSSPPTEVDLHRLLVWGPLGVRLPPAELWATSRVFRLADRDLVTLGLEETLLHTAYHLLIGGTPRALSVRDVAQLLSRPELDPERVLVLADRWGATAVLATAITMATGQLELVDRGPLTRWASGHRISRRDALWLRTHGPDHRLVGLEALATYLELRTREERRMLRAATFHPVVGTWPAPQARLGSVLRRLARRP
jgi:Uncharacterised nucleotidyltransferase